MILGEKKEEIEPIKRKEQEKKNLKQVLGAYTMQSPKDDDLSKLVFELMV